MPKNTKPGDISRGTIPTRSDPTDAQRYAVLTAALNDATILEAAHAGNVDRWTAEAIATAAGWSNRAMVEAARDRYAQAVGA